MMPWSTFWVKFAHLVNTILIRHTGVSIGLECRFCLQRIKWQRLDYIVYKFSELLYTKYKDYDV